MFVVDLVVGVIVAVVDSVVAWVAAVDVPENDCAATADSPPVSSTPRAAALRVTLEMRRNPASRRAMGSGGMGDMIDGVPQEAVWSF